MEIKFNQIRTFTGTDPSLPNLEVAERSKLIRASQLFAGLSITACAQIANRARPRVFARNEFLFMQGQPFRTLVLVESGCVKLTRLNANGSEVILALRGRFDAIDLPAGPNLSHHTFAAQALVKCRTLTWSSSVMGDLMTTPQFNGNICSILTRHLQELQERYQEMSAEKVERRVACAIIRLAQQFGTPTGGGTEISISRHELAQMTGTTLFTVSRLISKWGELGLILPRREAILILDTERLDLISSMDQQPTQKRNSVLADLLPGRVPASSVKWRSIV